MSEAQEGISCECYSPPTVVLFVLFLYRHDHPGRACSTLDAGRMAVQGLVPAVELADLTNKSWRQIPITWGTLCELTSAQWWHWGIGQIIIAVEAYAWFLLSCNLGDRIANVDMVKA